MKWLERLLENMRADNAETLEIKDVAFVSDELEIFYRGVILYAETIEKVLAGKDLEFVTLELVDESRSTPTSRYTYEKGVEVLKELALHVEKVGLVNTYDTAAKYSYDGEEIVAKENFFDTIEENLGTRIAYTARLGEGAESLSIQALVLNAKLQKHLEAGNYRSVVLYLGKYRDYKKGGKIAGDILEANKIAFNQAAKDGHVAVSLATKGKNLFGYKAEEGYRYF